MTNSNKAIKYAYSKGYRATKFGEIISPKGVNRKLRKRLDGYKTFTMRMPEVFTSISVHRFVAYQKFGDAIFSDNIQVRHIDGNPSNNSYENIEIGTPSQNAMDKTKEARLRSAIIATGFVKKHNHESIIRYYDKVKSYAKVMDKFGIKSKATVSFIIRKSLASVSPTE